MRTFNNLLKLSWTFLVAVFLTFGMTGCEGDDGAAGAAGATGPAGPAGADGADGPAGPPGADGADGDDATASVTPLESCGVCHSDGSFASAPAAHMLDPIESVSAVTFAEAAPILSISFDVEVDGAASEDYNVLQRIYVTEGTTNVNVAEFGTLTSNGGGNYTIDIDTVAAGLDTATPSRYVMRIRIDDDDETRVYFYGDYPASPFAGPVAVSAEACGACHGPEGIHVHGGGFQAADGGEPCLACHGVFAFGEERPSLAQVAHGYHSGIATWEDPPEEIEVTFPTYMNNCSVCHADEDQLAAVNAMPVTGEGCFSCHGSMDSWDFSVGASFHESYDETTNCNLCHYGDDPLTPEVEVGIGPPTVAAMHNGTVTERDGIIWNGADVSVTEGAKFDWQITDVVDDGVNLAISWTASYDGNSVDPCNDTATAGNPVFFLGAPEAELNMYRSYAQGDDFIIGTSTSAPGQAGRETLTLYDEVASPDGNTACQGLIATTTLPVDSIVAEKGRLALGGKPLVVRGEVETDNTAFLEEFGSLMPARVPTPTYDWSLDDGEMVARRNVVDTSKCLGCHVGSLYQHGGDRVDNVDMCLVCHNSASNEKNRRVAMGVDASEAYDGKTGETFEMKTMLHRIHSAATEDSPPYVIYRSRGIYAFAPDVADVPNWDVVSTEGCTADEIARGERLVFGGDPNSTTSCQPHNFHSATYPRSLNECTACHTDDFMVIPDQTKAMANTTEAGSEEAWANQLDDTLQGAATTACVTCHKDGASKGHAYQNSWTPQVFPEGRQTIIDAVN